MKTVVLDGYTKNPGDLSWGGFAALGELTVYDRIFADQILSCIDDTEIMIINRTSPTRETFVACLGTRHMGMLATGYNVVGTETAKEKGIPVTNIPTYSTTAVTQVVSASLLEICHHVGEHSEAVRHGEWTKSPDLCFWNIPLIELAGKAIGVIGFRQVEQDTAQTARALSLWILAYDEYPNDAARALGDYVTFDELLAQSDIISLHCPLFPSTKGIINKGSIAKMRDGVILINAPRGPLVAEADLVQALNSGKVYTAGLNVVVTEPIRTSSPLLNAKDCIIIPRIVWAPREDRARLMDTVVNNLKVSPGQKPVNMVNT